MADVKVYNPQGELGSIPEGQLSSALRLGFRQATPEDLALEKTREEYGGLSGQLGAATTGVLSGATFGLSDLALKELGAEEAIKAYRSLPELQAARTIGEVGGMIAPALFTGGTSVGARVLAATPAGLAARAGQAAAASVGARVGTGIVGTAARFAAQGATEAALQGVAQETTRLAFDNELSGERIGQIALAGLTSAGVGAGIGAGLGALGGLAKKAAAAIPEGVAATPLGQKIEAEIYRTQARLKGKSAADIDAAGGLATPKMRQYALEGEQGVVDIIQGKQTGGPFDAPEIKDGSLLDLLTKKAKNSQLVAQSVRDSGLKREALTGIVLDDADALLSQRSFVVSQLDDNIAKLDNAISAGGNEYAQAGLKPLRTQLQALRQSAEEAIAKGGTEGAEDLFMVGDLAKREIGRVNSRFEKLRNPSSTEIAVMRDIFEPSYDAWRVGLEDSSVWGRAADLNRMRNAPLTQSLAKNDAVKKHWYANTPTEVDPTNPWKRLSVSDPKKVRGIVANASAGVDEADMVLRQQIAFENESLDAALKYSNFDNISSVKADILKQKQINADLLKSLDEAQLRERTTAFAKSIGGGGASDSIVGVVAGAAIASGNPMFALMGPLLKTGLVMRGAEAVENIANGQAGRIGQGVGRVARAMRDGSVAAAERAPVVGAAAVRYQERSKRVRDLAAQSDAVRAELAKQTAWMSDRAPVAQQAAIGTALRTIDYLNANMPKGLAAPTPFAPALPPSRQEMQGWLARLKAIESPTSILDDLAKGKLTPEAVDAVRTVYPETFADIQAQVLEQLTKLEASGRRPKYADRVQLGIVMGMPTDPTMTPEVMQAVQGQYAQQSPETREGAPGAATAPRRGAKAPDMAAAFRSGSGETELTS